MPVLHWHGIFDGHGRVRAIGRGARSENEESQQATQGEFLLLQRSGALARCTLVPCLSVTVHAK